MNGDEDIMMKQNKQSDFVYEEAFEHCDKTYVRYRTKVDLNWKFLQDDTVDASAADFDDSAWRLLNLPHDWSIEGEYDQSNPSGGSGGYLPTGIGWYRKALSIPSEWRKGRRLYLAFDGVFTNSTVYVDGVKVGNREYGWLSFVCDITHVARDKESVTVAVKVDNSVQPAARWYTGSGIYSHVWVISAGEVHVAENGTYVTTPADDRGIPTGAVTLETVVKNDFSADAVISVRSTICRKCDDQPLAWVCSAPIALPSGGETTVHQQTQVDAPALWGPDAPQLHYVKTEILSGTEVLDDYATEFGFRAVTYDANGFYLNGENVVLKGVCNHWALGALGAAQSTNMIRYKIQFMKDMGVNCLRTSHNACPPEFYELCNEMGMMVMDEFSEGERGKTAGDYGTRWFQSLWKRDFEYWVRRDRNHPCIVVWSIGNEIGSMNDNTGISPHIKQFDLTRPTTGSMIFTGVDIPGANGISERADFTRPDESLPLIATEAPHTHASRGVYRTQTWYRGRFSEEGSGGIIYNLSDSEIFRYDWSSEAVGSRILPSDFDNATSQTSVRRHWTLTRDNDWRVGEFRWTGYDYLGEANYVLGGWPYRMFHSGAVDCAIFAKDMYYLYQSMWLKTPVLHILPSWTHPTMKVGTKIPVWVYSNCEKVELFLNGESQGVVDRGPIDSRDQHSIQFDWLVAYAEGTLTAVGYDGDGNEILRDSRITASAPAAITLKNTTDEELPLDPAWVGQITVSTVDKNGTLYPYGENRTYYHVSGPAYIKAADNGSPIDTESHVSFHRKAFMGLSKVFVAPSGDAGDIQFTAASILGEKRQLTSDRVSIDVRQLALRGNPEPGDFEIYYTTDGSIPTRASEKYTGAFSVALETCVKAAVYRCGDAESLFVMKETFGADEGMYWAGTGRGTVAENVCLAADAALSGDDMTLEPYGYEESFVNFNDKPGAVEYALTAPEAGDYYVAVCYNNGSGEAGDRKEVEVSVNGASPGKQPFFHNGPWNTFWAFHMLKVSLMQGENKIRFISSEQGGPNLKQLIFWRASDVSLATDALGEHTIAEYPSAFDDKAIDVGSGGSVSWRISGKPAGRYSLYFWYSTPRGGLREVSGAVNGTSVAVWSGQRVSPDYGSSWGCCRTEISLAPGSNLLTVRVPGGGALVGGMVLQSVKEYPAVATTVDSSCVTSVRLCSEKDALALTGTDDSSDGARWDLISDRDGLLYLVNRACGKVLTFDGTALALSDGETDGNAQWQRAGEAEFYDYLVHAATGKILVVKDDGTLGMDLRERYDDSDMITNRAYWRLCTEAEEK